MVGDFSRAIVTIHNFRSLQDLPQKMHYEAKEYASPHTCRTQKMWRESLRLCYTAPPLDPLLMHYEAKEYASCPCPSVVVSVFDDQRVMIINGDKQLPSTEDRESIEKYAAEEGITILEK